MALRDPNARFAFGRRVPVWGFPKGYDPNLMGDRCELCHRSDSWQRREIPGQDFNAWNCRCTTGGQLVIPD